LGNSLHIHGNEQHFTAHIGRGRSRFATGVAGTGNNYIVMGK
jgi:hypothetical protein